VINLFFAEGAIELFAMKTTMLKPLSSHERDALITTLDTIKTVLRKICHNYQFLS
jgi:hypothetical protein